MASFGVERDFRPAFLCLRQTPRAGPPERHGSASLLRPDVCTRRSSGGPPLCATSGHTEPLNNVASIRTSPLQLDRCSRFNSPTLVVSNAWRNHTCGVDKGFPSLTRKYVINWQHVR